MSFGKSRARMVGEDQVKITFADVAGVDEAKEELAEIVEFLRTAEGLEHLRDFRVADKMPEDDFIDACEQAISVENLGWMANWQAADQLRS